jgi:hypothetical protein
MTIVFCTMARHIVPSFHTPVPTLGGLRSGAAATIPLQRVSVKQKLAIFQ